MGSVKWRICGVEIVVWGNSSINGPIGRGMQVDVSIENIAFWRELAPEMTIEVLDSSAQPIAIDEKSLTEIGQRMTRDGFLQLPPVLAGHEVSAVCRAIERLQSVNLPPVYIYVYDQPWRLFQRLSPLLRHFLGHQYALLPNFWAWSIPLVDQAAGWPLHRDCDAQTRFDNPDFGQTLMSLSLWLPLSDATLENGCMYVLPKSRQERYPETIKSVDEIDDADRRALPAKAGSVLGWSQDLYHWSGSVTAQARNPRVSLSLEFQNTSFEALAEPLLDVGAPPQFSARLALIAQQFDKYRHMEMQKPPETLPTV